MLQRDGQSIGLVGLTIANKTQQSSSPDPGTVFGDETAAAQQQIDALRAQGVNKIIVMSHIGYDYDKQIIPNLSGVDVVVGGDSHTLLGPAGMAGYGVGSPAGAYPTEVKNKDGKRVCLVQAWEYSQVVGELKVSFDANGDVTACAGTPHVLMGSAYKIGGAAVSPADQAAIAADIKASGFLYPQEPDAGALAVLQPSRPRSTRSAPARWRRCRRNCARAACRAGRLARLQPVRRGLQHAGQRQPARRRHPAAGAQAYLEVGNASYGGADISLQSGGGVRVPLKGTVTAANVIEVVPFGNMLWRLNVTGAEVKSMLEDGMQAVYGPGGSTGPYPYTGGLRFDVNAAQPQGSRVSNIEVYDAATSSWGPLDASRTYKLFVLSFNATGGDGYKTLANVPAARRQDIGVLDADVLQAYMTSRPGSGHRPAGAESAADQPVQHQVLHRVGRAARARERAQLPAPARGAVRPGTRGRCAGAGTPHSACGTWRCRRRVPGCRDTDRTCRTSSTRPDRPAPERASAAPTHRPARTPWRRPGAARHRLAAGRSLREGARGQDQCQHADDAAMERFMISP